MSKAGGLMLQLLLTIFLVSTTHNLVLDGNYEEAKKIMEITPITEYNKAEYYYLKSIIYYAENDFKNAKKNIDDFNFVSNNKTPFRWKVLVDKMSEDVEVWKNGDLSDIGRDMKNSTTRLETGKSGPKTQKVQKDIIDKLDKKIKDLEDEENKKNEQAAAEKNKQEPSRESIPLDDQGKGIVDEKKLRKIAEARRTQKENGREEKGSQAAATCTGSSSSRTRYSETPCDHRSSRKVLCARQTG
jgi:hypothetical protein